MTCNPRHTDKDLFLVYMENNQSVCVLDELTIEMSSKSGLGNLTAAYRVKVLLFISVSVLLSSTYCIISVYCM